MSHRHYWAKIEYQGAELAGSMRALRRPGRNAEKFDVMVSIGSRSSILGGPGEPNY